MKACWMHGVLFLGMMVHASAWAAAKVSSETKTDSERLVRVVNRLAVVSHLERLDDPEMAQEFARHIRGYMRRRGVICLVQTRNPLAVEADKRAYSRDLQAFDPQAVLVFEPGDGTVNEYGEATRRKFESGLIPYPLQDGRKEVVWRCQMDLRGEKRYITKRDMKPLAEELARQMLADGILPSVAPPLEEIRKAKPKPLFSKKETVTPKAAPVVTPVPVTPVAAKELVSVTINAEEPSSAVGQVETVAEEPLVSTTVQEAEVTSTEALLRVEPLPTPDPDVIAEKKRREAEAAKRNKPKGFFTWLFRMEPEPVRAKKKKPKPTVTADFEELRQ